MLNFLKARLFERSTWIGIAAAAGGGLATASQFLTSEEAHWIARAVVLCGVIAALVPTTSKPQETNDASPDT